MINKRSALALGLLLAPALVPAAANAADIPEAIAVPGSPVVTMHAEGAQVYQCADDAGKLVWKFREPIATLVVSGTTVGRHYVGPHWELADGSVIRGKVSGSAPGAGKDDIPLLRLDVVSRSGKGQLEDIATIQRLNTKGGFAEGACPVAGAFLSVPYAADYAFFRKRN